MTVDERVWRRILGAANGATTAESHTLIPLPAGTGMRGSLDAAARRAGIELPVTMEASDPSVIVELASRGLGVAVVSASIAALRADVLHVLSIRPTITSHLALVWRAGGPSGAASRAVLELAHAHLLGESRAIGAASTKRLATPPGVEN